MASVSNDFVSLFSFDSCARFDHSVFFFFQDKVSEQKRRLLYRRENSDHRCASGHATCSRFGLIGTRCGVISKQWRTSFFLSVAITAM